MAEASASKGADSGRRRWWHPIRRWYYDGPAVFNYPGRKIVGYRSPTMVGWIWLKSWALTWFTPAGRIMLVVTVMVSMVGLLSDLMPVYYLSFLLLGMFLVDWAFGRWYRPRLQLERLVPTTATAGVPFKVRYRLQPTAGARRSWQIFIDTVPPPPHMRFLDHGVQLPTVPETPIELERTIVTRRRGRYHLPLAVADSAFPFGLWRAGTRAAPNAPILVLPAYRPLGAMPVPRRRGQARGGETESQLMGDSLNFLACREYRYGDNPRHLHAAAWARIGRPVVKEFSDERALQVAIVLDLRIPPPGLTGYLQQELMGKADHRFEALVSLTAAIADYVHREGGAIHLYVPGWRPEPVVPRGANALREILAALATVDPDVGGELPISETLKAELRDKSGVILTTALPDASWRDCVVDLAEGGGAYGVAVTKESGGPRDYGTAVRSRDVLAGEVRTLTGANHTA